MIAIAGGQEAGSSNLPSPTLKVLVRWGPEGPLLSSLGRGDQQSAGWGPTQLRHPDVVNPPRYEAMLAVSGRPTGSLAGWCVEAKLDGWRAIGTVTDSPARVESSPGRDV